MKKRFPHYIRLRKRRKGDGAQLAAQLAPLEELDKQAAQQQGANGHSANDGRANRQQGAIVVENEKADRPKGITEDRDGKGVFGIEPVVIVILLVMLTFIAFIAWEISKMPPA